MKPKIVLAADHAGFQLKELVKKHLLEMDYQVDDLGAYEYDKEDDYPDFITPAAGIVASSKNCMGIIFGGSGQGEAMVANRINGVRAAVYYDGPQDIVLLSRQHNNANILSLGARFLSSEKALKVIDQWLKTPFEGERHERRIKKFNHQN
jgi:ribose 5-phosphate isomerase B